MIKLPAVDEAINRSASKSRNSCQSPTITHNLPTTPQTEEELHRGLVRLYSKRVHTNPQSTQISYRDTAVILSAVQDPLKRNNLKEILNSEGLTFLTCDEYKTLSKAAEGTTTEPKAGNPHPLVVSTSHQEGEPQVVSIHMGGPWGIKLTHYEL